MQLPHSSNPQAGRRYLLIFGDKFLVFFYGFKTCLELKFLFYFSSIKMDYTVPCVIKFTLGND